MAEILEVVDENNQVIGTESRKKVHETGLRHRVVHVLIINSKNEKERQPNSEIDENSFRLNLDEIENNFDLNKMKKYLSTKELTAIKKNTGSTKMMVTPPINNVSY